MPLDTGCVESKHADHGANVTGLDLGIHAPTVSSKRKRPELEVPERDDPVMVGFAACIARSTRVEHAPHVIKLDEPRHGYAAWASWAFSAATLSIALTLSEFLSVTATDRGVMIVTGAQGEGKGDIPI